MSSPSDSESEGCDKQISERDPDQPGGSSPPGEPAVDHPNSNENCQTTIRKGEGNSVNRPRRKVSRSIVGKESRVSELHVILSKTVNTEYKQLGEIQATISQGVTLDDLYDRCDDMDARMGRVCDVYNELLSLCDNDENKINSTIKTNYGILLSHAGTMKEAMEEKITAMEQEEDTAAEQRNKELEEQAKIFQDLLSNTLPISINLKQSPNTRQETTATVEENEEEQSASIITTTASSTMNSRTSTPSAGPHQTAAPTPTRRSVTSHTGPSENHQATDYNSTNQQDTGTVITTFLQGLNDILYATNKKSVEPELFKGDMLKFSDWEVDVDTYFRKEKITGHERLRHLKNFIAGDARKCIEGHFVTNTNEAYEKARTILKERYGNEYHIARRFRKKLEEWPAIAPGDGKALREFSDYLEYLQSAMETFKQLKVLNDCVENEKMVNKVPLWLRRKWARVVAKAQAAKQDYPSFAEFAQLVKEEAYIMNLEISKPGAQDKTRSTKDQQKSSKIVGSFSTMSTEMTAKQCLFCKHSSHEAADCNKLQKLSKTERDEFMKGNGLCFRCVEQGHRYKGCNNRKKCRICSKGHATANHDPNWQPWNTQSSSRELKNAVQSHPTSSLNKSAQSTVKTDQIQLSATSQQSGEKSCHAIGIDCHLTSMIVPVYMSAGTGREVLVYAMLDNMSDACYVSSKVVDMLKAQATDVERGLTIHTINGANTADVERFDEITLRGYATNNTARISAYKKEHIYFNREQLPCPERAKKFDHLLDIADDIPPILDIPVGLLIGANFPEVIQPTDTRPARPGETGKAFAVKTLFGWTMAGGTVSGTDKARKHSFKTNISKDTQLLNILERDFHDIEKEDSYQSQEDRKFMEIMESSTKQNEVGNYTMPLPFRAEVHLPDNRAQVEKRFEGILKKFKADRSYYEEYKKFMDGLVEAGHAEEVTTEHKEGKVWYLPHFGVRHKQKKKLRVVFDASAKYKDVSLNSLLLSGPDHINSLLGILMRFRLEPIAIICDIQQMFYNFEVQPIHRDFLRFLWTDDLQTVKEYHMNVHLFGAASSPAVATFGLRRLADDYQAISPEAARFLKQDFYVDDGVTSLGTVDQAVDLIKRATELCSKGNIRLHKFLSNNKEVLASVPESERSESTKNLDLFKDQLPQERTLGMEWSVEADCFHFGTPNMSKPTTKRGILATVAQIYDPMGLISPVILKGRLILQRVVASDISWDQLIPLEQTEEWKTWLRDLENLGQIQIPRCVKPTGALKAVELHHFSDASQNGYGACSYLKQITDNGVTCNLLLSKARVAPLKKVTTIPRLELQGAVTAVKLANTIKKELKLHIDQEFFWCDSQIVLGYIQNESKRFHVYVANRVADIRQSTTAEQWNYVNTTDNPADIASRGCKVADLLNDSKWLQGPSFLNEADITGYIRQNQVETTIDHTDPEVRKIATTLTSITTTSLLSLFNRYSYWKTLVRSIAILKACAKRRVWKIHQLEPTDIMEAEEYILGTVQSTSYPKKEKEPSLAGLNPQVDDKGIIRVGGRATAATNWGFIHKHPIIIPKQSHVANLIINDQHEKVHHLGRRSTLAGIRDAGYWIINGPNLVKKALQRCVTCKILRKLPEKQQMGNLPEERLERTPPFTNVGIDVFGPFHVKDKRTENKRWGLMITCLYSRAIHIELLEDMSTDCVIQAFRCFTALRGPVSTVICDNGTNFVGMSNELNRQITLARTELRDYLQRNKVTFKFNSPDASHQGGATERMIRSARAVLQSIMLRYKHRMDTKTLRTVFYESANVVNNRPLTGTSIDDPQDSIMTPNRLLTTKETPLLAPPPGKFPTEDIYSTKRWKIAQAIADEFWKAWKSEYLQTITPRQKWIEIQRNIKVGDIVLVVDDNAARNDWRRGVISDVVPGRDGLVRNVYVTLGNRHLDRSGKPLAGATVLKRPIQKLILLVSR